MKKQLVLFGLTAMVGGMGIAGCGQSSGKTSIGILQPVEHTALGATREGFTSELKKLGFDDSKVDIVYRNAGGKEADLSSLAKDLVGRCDMTFGIGTGAAKALFAASIEKGKTNPLLFSAVTDPVDAGLVKSLENGSGFATGTSDINPVESQVSLIRDCVPEADKVGILYTINESNSVVQANLAKAELEKEGIEVFTQTATGPADVSASASALAAVQGIDAIYIPTDNNIAANPDAVKSAVQNSGILVVAGEENLVKDLGSITLSVDYTKLGEMTGAMAASILKKEKNPGQIPVGFMSKDECEYIMSSVNAAAAGVTIPQSIAAKCRDVSLSK